MKDLERDDNIHAQAIAKTISNKSDDLLAHLARLNFNRAEGALISIKMNVIELEKIFKRYS
ncbi:hypothetical protein J4437_01205 [Candidatus Woesearchaeota archaeon]|nr:hypothetical protein [Candidatus Woesearchaeota archaeon]